MSADNKDQAPAPVATQSTAPGNPTSAPKEDKQTSPPASEAPASVSAPTPSTSAATQVDTSKAGTEPDKQYWYKDLKGALFGPFPFTNMV